MARYGEIWGDMGRSRPSPPEGEIWGDMGRYVEIWGDMWRYGEVWGGAPLLGRRAVEKEDTLKKGRVRVQHRRRLRNQKKKTKNYNEPQ